MDSANQSDIRPKATSWRGHALAVCGALVLTACAGVNPLAKKSAPLVVPRCAQDDSVCQSVRRPDSDTLRPRARPAQGDTLRVTGNTASEFDQASAADTATAGDTSATVDRPLGTTIASLGDVAEQGFWLKTPLVTRRFEGRVRWEKNGKSVNVTLIPKGGEKSGGSQISLSAMRLLDIPLTALPKLVVYVR